jgi:hypothetical protein
MIWARSAVERLRQLWASGVPAAQIAAAIGASKHGVLGKARRLSLALRGSPIVRHAAPRPRPAPRGEAVQRLAVSLWPPPRRCQWIAGEPSADDGCKCGRPVRPASSYCAAHHRRAWKAGSPLPARLGLLHVGKP